MQSGGRYQPVWPSGYARDDKFRAVNFVGSLQIGWTERNRRSLHCDSLRFHGTPMPAISYVALS
jgi:hypothetical protein